NKDVLNMTEPLIVHQTTGPQERKALRDWIVEKGSDVNLVEELPSLEVGEAYVWSPRWLKILDRVRVEMPRTLDSSATPKFGSKTIATRKLDPLDLEQIQTAMKDVIQHAQENDPKELRARLVQLQKQLQSRPAETKVVEKIVEREVPVIGD